MPETRPPPLSIVVLAHNRPRELTRCLASITRQTLGSFEVIIVDDGSEPPLRAVANAYPRFRYVRRPHGGVAAARNTGIGQSRGEIVAFVADDYQLPTNYVRHVLRFFEEHPTARCVRFLMEAADDSRMARACHWYYECSVRNNLEGAQRPQQPLHWLAKTFRRLPPLPDRPTTRHRLEAAGAAAYSKQVFRRTGTFDETLRRGEDSDFSLRLRAAGIDLFLDPRLKVKRSYEKNLRDAVRKQWWAGFDCARYEQRDEMGRQSLWRELLRQPWRALVMPIWRARQGETPGEGWRLLPRLYALEAAHKGGYLVGLLGHRGSPRG